MTEPSPLTPSSWESFYVILGSSSAALIGLQFVVVTLIAERSVNRTTAHGISTYTTPTVVHFAGVTLVSAIMTTPWPSIAGLWIALLLSGIGGVLYGIRVLLRTRRQTTYVPVVEDWLWYVLLPILAYAVLGIAGWLVRGGWTIGPFLVASSALVLLIVGIHNAWDTVTYVVTNDGAG